METSNTGLEKAIVYSAIAVGFTMLVIGVNYYGSFNGLLNALNNFFDTISNLPKFDISFQWLINYKALFIIGIKILVLLLALFAFYKIAYFLYLIIMDVINKYRFVKREAIRIENMLLTEAPYDEKMITDEIETLREKLALTREYQKLKCFNGKLKKRLEACLKLLREKQKDKRIAGRKRETELMERRAQEIDEEIRIKQTREESDRDLIIYKLRAGEKDVFKKDKLSKNQVRALEKDGFEQRTEFSLFERKYIRVLVKSELNHSRTHTFLVWDTLRLLKEFKEIKNIQEHLTVDADITFNFKGKRYALEIETGTLLSKKDQKEEKINYLNRKYRKRWMIIVSNKNILSKYQELGFSTQRKWVLQDIKKLLEIA